MAKEPAAPKKRGTIQKPVAVRAAAAPRRRRLSVAWVPLSIAAGGSAALLAAFVGFVLYADADRAKRKPAYLALAPLPSLVAPETTASTGESPSAVTAPAAPAAAAPAAAGSGPKMPAVARDPVAVQPVPPTGTAAPGTRPEVAAVPPAGGTAPPPTASAPGARPQATTAAATPPPATPAPAAPPVAAASPPGAKPPAAAPATPSQTAKSEAAVPPKTEPPPAPKAEIPSRIALGPVPDPALVAKTPRGPLPVVAPNGRKAWEVYARPFADDGQRPLIAVLLSGVGLSQSATKTAIQQLPGQVTLAFAAYAPNVDRQIAEARAAGHEVMLQLPMEPINYPASDPGPHTLLTSLTATENIDRMEFILSRFAGYVGVTSYMGSRFTTSLDHMRPVMSALNQRGLLFLDGDAVEGSVTRTLSRELGLPSVVNHRVLDRQASRAAIDTHLIELEQLAKAEGVAIGLGHPFPVTIERVTQWAPTLKEKGIALAPISAAIKRQQAR